MFAYVFVGLAGGALVGAVAGPAAGVVAGLALAVIGVLYDRAHAR